MPESLDAWWNRRRRSKGSDIPYPIGTFRDDWQRFPVLIRQFHPDLNGFVTLTQIPPAADVFLLWQCESGHRFVATPTEQRERPGADRRRSTWCPECTALALGRRLPRPAAPAFELDLIPPDADSPSARAQRVLTAPARPLGSFPPARASPRPPRGSRRSSRRSREEPPQLQPGTAFASLLSPPPASAAEADLRERIAARLDVDLTCTAVQVRRRFHDRWEVWPDILIPELMVAIEYDTTGRSSTEHVGRREASDRWKDRLLREVGWEVVRIRTSKLLPLGAFDVTCSSVTDRVVDRVIERLREIRGDLIVAAYSRPAG